MKKSEFSGIDRKVVEDTRVDVEPFKDMGDFYKYCNGLTDMIKNKNYGGRRVETKTQRQSILQEWFDYVIKGNDAYTPAISYMILNGISRNLKPNDDTLPPVLNKGVLAKTVCEAQNKVDKENNLQFNFGKMYNLNLQKSYLSTDKDKPLNENLNGWIIVPSKEQDPENFDENVEKLKMLSHDNWCTKSFNAEPYLRRGEFHVYMENGKPRLGVRFEGDEIQEIQGPKNNSIIPLRYHDSVTKHIKKYKLASNAQKEVADLKKRNREVKAFLKKHLPNGVENATTQEILEASGIKCEKDKEGLLTISHYRQPSAYFSFDDIGVNEKQLFKQIKEIKMDVDFRNSCVQNLGGLLAIGGSANFECSQITDLGSLKTIGRDANFRNSQVTSLGKLITIGRNADFRDSKVTDMGDLETIGGDADFSNSEITDLCYLETIGGKADFKDSNVEDLGNLESIGGDADFGNSEITDLCFLETIGGDANFYNSQVAYLSDLKSIGGNADFRYSQIEELDNLEIIGQNVNFGYTEIVSLGKLKIIGGDADFRNSNVADLCDLHSIGCNVYINDSGLNPLDFMCISVGGEIIE